MVSKKRVDYGFSGFRPLTVPRAPRSIRRRGSRKKLVEDDKLCAFELLAAVAGKLLQESESSASSNVADEKVRLGIPRDEKYNMRFKNDKSLKLESHDRGSCVESAFVPEISVRECNLLFNFKGVNDSALEQASAQESSDFLKNIGCDIKLGISEGKDGNTKSEVGGSICSGDSYKNILEDDKDQIGELSTAKSKSSTVKDSTEERVNTNTLINSDSSVKLPLYRDPVKHYSNVQLGIRDDGENSFGYNKLSTRIRPLRPQSRVGHHKIRKMLASKYWITAPKLKDCELYKTRDGINTYYRYRKGIYTRKSCQQVPIKKRKLSNQIFANPYDQDASNDSISTLPDKVKRGEQITTDPHVKFSIKSFKVPELYIEVPETATVGSLKRTVMEAVNAILGSGIRVGIALQGKKVRDDNRTLQQAGISKSSTLDNLGFTLEPNFANVSPSMTPKKRPLVLSHDENEQFKRSPATPIIDSGISNGSTDTSAITKLDDAFDNNEFVLSPINAQTNGAVVSDSQALVPMFPMNDDALAVVPVSSKPKRGEVSQRRTRRPFSVAEVELLVAAVEKLGTGRWRDVKMCAFQNADHRTYVDLKDKWKTLVHTANIAPQQRRGEPVPQDLLDRVLCTHSYWTQNPPKQHENGKQVFVEPLKIEDGVGT